MGKLTRDLAKKRGWSAQVAEGTVLGQWPSVVGQQIADHATPTGLNDGVLSVAAESTAWATQLRIVQAQLLAKIAAAVGNGVVTSLKSPARPHRRGERAHGISPVGVHATPTGKEPDGPPRRHTMAGSRAARTK